jgi:hypothetical protein
MYFLYPNTKKCTATEVMMSEKIVKLPGIITNRSDCMAGNIPRNPSLKRYPVDIQTETAPRLTKSETA